MKYRIEYVDEIRSDLERIAEFLFAWHADDSADIFEAIERSIETLMVNPYLGRPLLTRRKRRELIIGRGKLGYIVRYSIDEGRKLVLILGIRGQRERTFRGRG